MNGSDPKRDDRPEPDAELVVVFQTTEAGLLPLARAALDEAGIDYSVQNRGFADQLLGRRSSMTVGETETPLLVVVREEDETRAREALSELRSGATAAAGVEPAATVPGAPPPPPAAETGSPGELQISDAASGRVLGHLTRSQFDSMAKHLELESTRDDDFYIDTATVAMLEERNADPAALALLRRALAERSDVTIRWR
jgi:hypothetical protein